MDSETQNSSQPQPSFSRDKKFLVILRREIVNLSIMVHSQLPQSGVPIVTSTCKQVVD